jgi:S1-C subfamily serine protease
MLAALLPAGCSHQTSEPAPPAGFQEVVTLATGRVFPAVAYISAVADNLENGKAEQNVVSGSGVLISPDGELLSNWHVVDKAQKIRCQLNDGRAFSARVIGKDKDVDLALLKLDVPAGSAPLPFAEIDRDGKLAEGDFVMAMGAPWGMNRSVSIGIVSCASRYLPDSSAYSLWYQTDASISPGNSGGPLVDTRGRVVGINTLAVMYGGNMGFSIPAPTVLDVLPRLRAYGNMNWAWFGLQLQPLRDFNRDIYFDFAEGVIVSGTEPGSPARRAGFLPNDRIVELDGKPVTVATDEAMPGFRRELGLLPFGEKVAFTVMRDGKRMTIETAPVAKGAVEGEENVCSRWGFTAKAINRFDSPNLYFYRNEGVYIFGTSRHGNAMRHGLRDNDIILSINGREIGTPGELNAAYRDAIANLETSSKATFAILRNGRKMQLVLDFYNDYDKD